MRPGRRRRVLVLATLVALAVVAGRLLRGSGASAPPSVLLVSIDTCRADRMGFLGGRKLLPGGASPTPNLDALAQRSGPWREGLSPAPLTLPAHVSILSGLDPDAHGVRENDSFAVPPLEDRGYSLLAEDLRAAGYDTAAFVSGQPLERAFGLDAGFRIYVQPTRDDDPTEELRFRERTAEATTEDALQYLAGVGDRPFFLFVHYFDPHHPYLRRPGFEALPSGPEGDYLSEIMAVDQQIGRLLAALPERGERMLVIVLGDHGEGLGEHGEATHGYLLHEATLRVPFLLQPPAGRAAVAAPAAPARLIDVQPTVLAITGVPPALPIARDGRNLLDREPASWTCAAETLYPYYQFQYARLRAVRDRDRKLVDGGGREEVFAWRDDPGEVRDLAAAEPGTRQRLGELQRAHLARPLPGRARSREVVPSAAVPYFGGRPLALPVEPTEEQNRALRRVEDRWEVIRALDAAREKIREKRPGEAAFLLARHDAELATNPSLLFWTARAEDLAGRDSGLSRSTRLEHLERAQALFSRHVEQWDDGKAVDALIRVHLERHDVTGAKAELDQAAARATSEINRGRARPLTWALRALARERAGDRDGAAADFQEAARRDPDDPRHLQNLRRLRPPGR